MSYCDEDFVQHEETFSGIVARIIQHEYDHIDGKLFVDHFSAVKKRLIQSKLKNIARGIFNAEYPCKIE